MQQLIYSQTKFNLRSMKKCIPLQNHILTYQSIGNFGTKQALTPTRQAPLPEDDPSKKENSGLLCNHLDKLSPRNNRGAWKKDAAVALTFL